MKWLAIGALLLVAATGCSDRASSSQRDESEPTTTTTTLAQRGSSDITKFVVPKSAECGGATFTTVSVEYAITGAARAELRVDGRPIVLTDPQRGSVNADIRCDPLPHDFVIVAYDANGEYVTAEKLLETKA